MAVPNLRQWKNGEVFNARDYVYERNLIIAEINRLSALVGDSQSGTINLTVNALTANSMTMNGRTITDFAEAGNKTFLSSTEPTTNYLDGDLWFDTSE